MIAEDPHGWRPIIFELAALHCPCEGSEKDKRHNGAGGDKKENDGHSLVR